MFQHPSLASLWPKSVLQKSFLDNLEIRLSWVWCLEMKPSCNISKNLYSVRNRYIHACSHHLCQCLSASCFCQSPNTHPHVAALSWLWQLQFSAATSWSTPMNALIAVDFCTSPLVPLPPATPSSGEGNAGAQTLWRCAQYTCTGCSPRAPQHPQCPRGH